MATLRALSSKPGNFLLSLRSPGGSSPMREPGGNTGAAAAPAANTARPSMRKTDAQSGRKPFMTEPIWAKEPASCLNIFRF